MGCLRIHRQASCNRPVRRKVRKIKGRACIETFTGNAHSRAIQSFASPAPIQPCDQARNRPRLASQTSGVPGKCATNPARNSGRVAQFGMRRVRRSYRARANA